METITFKGIGTYWSVSIDESVDDVVELKKTLFEFVADFESRFSRFISSSEVNQFRKRERGTYPLSAECALLFSAAHELRTLTHGAFDPAVAGLLEGVGYDATYRLTPDESAITSFVPTAWSLSRDQLAIDGPVGFDFGGIGKGYCIDRVHELLKEKGYHYFIVEAGGDMVATTKADGSGWRVAIEYPGKPDIALGLVELVNQGLAVSDSFRRRFGAWHHIVDPRTKAPVTQIIGVAAIAPTAWQADKMTSGLFLGQPAEYALLAEKFSSAYLVVTHDGMVQKSINWKGELF